jgi:ketopantoate reductase
VKVCVVGAGAIGGMIAVKLALSGEDVSVIDRGPHLAAIETDGLKLRWHDGTVLSAKVGAFEKAADAGEQDLVVLAVKSYDLVQAVTHIEHLLGPDTMVMTVQNGIPWWYFQREGGTFQGRTLTSLDPDGILALAVDAKRIIGSVAYPAAALVEPGMVRHIEGDRFPVGELDGSETERVGRVSEAFNRSGLRSRVINDIRAEIWLKAWGSLSFNPISALTHATMEQICRSPQTRQLAADMMTEAQVIAEKLGIKFRHTIEKRLEGAEAVGPHKTSMLQDLEEGRPLETEALVGSILEMGRLTDTPTPASSAVYALLKLLENILRASGGGLKIAGEAPAH